MERSKLAEDIRGCQGRIAVAVASLVGIALVLTLPGCGDSKKGTETQSSSNGAAAIVSANGLREATAGRATPVYWAGERQGTKLELSQPSNDRTYIRYLTGSAKAGDQRALFLTVSTYAQSEAVSALRRQGKKPGGVLGVAPGNGTVYFDRSDPQSVYLAYPGVPVEIEVYDPSSRRALQLVNSGQIVAIG